ncbi:DUF748 domain-containing protein [uncultured Marinobacter sp.]|uniref:DUF748 domain-containing protein n=1 Tax=uncultured Marinobacter sp. TaxID=187379 RepID=UPI0030DA4E13
MTASARSKSRFMTLVFCLTALVLVLLLAAFVALPRYLEHSIPRQLDDAFGWQTRVGDISTNPFTLTVSVADLHAVNRHGESTLAWNDLDLRLGFWPLLKGRLQPVSVTLDQPLLRLDRHDDGTWSPWRDWPAAWNGDDLRRADVRVMEGQLLINDHFAAGPQASGEQSTDEPGTSRYQLTLHSLVLQDPENSEAADGQRALLVQGSDGEQSLELEGLLAGSPGGQQGLRLAGTLDARQLGLASLARLLEPMEVAVPDAGLAASAQADLSTEFEWVWADRQSAIMTRNGQLVLRDLVIASGDSERVFVTLAEGQLSGLAMNSANQELVVSSVSLLRPEFMLDYHEQVREQWRTRADDRWIRELADWRWSVGGLNLSEGRLSVRNLLAEAEVVNTVESIELSLGAMTERLEEPVVWQVRGQMAEGGQLSASGQYTLRPFTLGSGFDLDQLALAPLAGYLTSPAAFVLAGGTLSLRGQLDLDGQDQKLTGTFEGNGSISQFDLRSSDPGASVSSPEGSGETVAGWRELRLGRIEYNLAPARLELGEVSLSEPTVLVRYQPDTGFNLAPLFASRSEEPEPTPSAEASAPLRTLPLIFRMRDLTVNSAELRYYDSSFTPEFSSRVHGLNGVLTRIANVPPLRGQIQLEGALNERSRLELVGAVGTMKVSDQEVISDDPVVLDMILALDYRLSGLARDNRFRRAVDRLLERLPGQAEPGLSAPGYLPDEAPGDGTPVEGRFRLNLR